MSVKKQISLIFGGVAVTFAVLTVVMGAFSPSESAWIVNVFRDKVLVFIIVPVFLLISAYADGFFKIPAIVRMQNRRKSVQMNFIYKSVIAFVEMTIYFVLFIIVSIIYYRGIVGKTPLEVLFLYILYILNLILAAVVTEIFKHSEKRGLNISPYMLTYVIVIAEDMIIIPTVKNSFDFLGLGEMFLFFSWVFDGSIKGIIIMTVFVTVCTAYLFKVSSRKDII